MKRYIHISGHQFYLLRRRPALLMSLALLFAVINRSSPILIRNRAMIPLLRWSYSESLCAARAAKNLDLAADVLASAERDASGLSERVTRYQRLCAGTQSTDLLCHSMAEIMDLPFRGLDYSFGADSGWHLRGYWIDDALLQLDKRVTAVLKWDVSDDRILSELEAGRVVSAEDRTGQEWCIARHQNAVFQVGLLENLVPDGSFDRSLLPPSDFPWSFHTNVGRSSIKDIYLLADDVRGSSGATRVSCIMADASHAPDRFGPGLYTALSLTGEQPFLFQGAVVKTTGGANAAVGGRFARSEGPEEAHYAARRVQTAGSWKAYAQFVPVPSDVFLYNFRVANWGESGAACFDSIVLVGIVDPRDLVSAYANEP